MAKSFKATWLGDGDPAAQSIDFAGIHFVKGEPTTVPEDVKVAGHPFADAIRDNPAFSVGSDGEEPVESPGELEALKAKLDEAGIKYPANATVETLRGKLPA